MQNLLRSKLLVLLIFCVMTLAISGCGGEQTDKPGDESSSSSSSGGESSSSSSSSSSSGAIHLSDHCSDGFSAHESDASMTDSWSEYVENGETDITLQPQIINWMSANAWQEGHFLWHQVRRCGSGGFGGFGGGTSVSGIDPCQFTDHLPEQNECEGPQDGYEFLVMHRHMILALKQLWPSQVNQLAGWQMFPNQNDYPEIVQQYYREWNAQVKQDAALADGIPEMTLEEVLQLWPTEGHFGQWIQCGSLQGGIGLNGLHGALHFNAFPPNNQAHSIANQNTNLDAYLFWKLHGWIDNVWEHYREKVGLTPVEPKLVAELQKQCEEHHFWAEQVDPSLGHHEPDTPVEEHGFFHEQVRPIFERAGCTGCHGAGETAGLRLGYEVSSQQIVTGLVGVEAKDVEGYQLVVAGDPDNSWLYLKVTGKSESLNVVCRPNAAGTCKQLMPGFSSAEQELLRQWILMGAPTPTSN